MPWLHRYVGNPLLSATLNLFYRTRISDTHSGLRAFRREAYERLGLRTTGMEFASEMLIAAARARWRIAEVPIAYRPRAGESKLHTFRDGWRHLRLLLLYSPTHLFTVPGADMLIAGMVDHRRCSSPAPSRSRGASFDFHFMFVGSLLATLGTQVLLLGVFAKSVGARPRWFTLERGLVLGVLAVVRRLADQPLDPRAVDRRRLRPVERDPARDPGAHAHGRRRAGAVLVLLPGPPAGRARPTRRSALAGCHDAASRDR